MLEYTTLERRDVLRTLAAAGLLSAGSQMGGAQTANTDQSGTMNDLIPLPVERSPNDTAFTVDADTEIRVGSAETAETAEYLGRLLRPATGYDLPVGPGPDAAGNAISLRLSEAPAEVGEEGYEMTVTADEVVVRANEPAGLFYAVQTLRQLLPPEIESDTEQSTRWTVPGGRILDYPRFEYRGAMLDVARHFFPVETVKRYIDELALYKINHLHLHLTDDQGWRIQIDSWPRLTEIGGSTEVGGGPGGYYTKVEYKEIVAYARERNITVIPEIDMPGHTNAALASYPELNCDGEAPDLYTGTSVGFSSLCVDKEITYEFVEDVIREVAELTPGPYIHLGGDEADETSEAAYDRFFERVLPIARKYGKTPIGWHQLLDTDPPDYTVGQYWGTDREAPDVEAATQRGNDLVLSPASRSYLDMKYDENTPPELGLDWAGYNSVRNAYNWDPGSYVDGVSESSVMGPEAPLWTETIDSIDDIEFMAFPQLPGVAELGWSPDDETEWQGYRHRLAAHAPRWDVMGINYYRSPAVPWAVNHYQVDFVRGEPIQQFGENGLYADQNRLMRFAFGSVGEGFTEKDTAWPSKSIRECLDYGHITEREDGTAAVTFTVAEGCEPTLTLAVYSLPGATFDTETADHQELLDATTRTFGPGEHTITVPLPTNGGD